MILLAIATCLAVQYIEQTHDCHTCTYSCQHLATWY